VLSSITITIVVVIVIWVCFWHSSHWRSTYICCACTVHFLVLLSYCMFATCITV